MDKLGDFQRICVQAVQAAGALLLERMGRVQVREKGPADLVTEADLASQELVRGIVLDAFPDHGLIGEEETGHASGRSEYRWIVDPLDGTTNYVHSYPFFCVSLALERCGELLVGAVYNPNSGECFTAARGQGACLNGQPIHTSRVNDVVGAVAMAGLPSRVSPASPDLRVFNQAAMDCQSVRRTGSAALNCAFVAAGRADIVWSFSTKVWDIAAGVLLIREAGGVVTSPTGTEFDLDQAHFAAAATPALHQEFLSVVQRGLR